MKKIFLAVSVMLACSPCFAEMRGFGNCRDASSSRNNKGWHAGVLAPSIENVVGSPIYAADEVLTTQIIDTRPVNRSSDNPYHDYGFACDGFNPPCEEELNDNSSNNDARSCRPVPVSSHIMR